MTQAVFLRRHASHGRLLRLRHCRGSPNLDWIRNLRRFTTTGELSWLAASILLILVTKVNSWPTMVEMTVYIKLNAYGLTTPHLWRFVS